VDTATAAEPIRTCRCQGRFPGAAPVPMTHSPHGDEHSRPPPRERAASTRTIRPEGKRTLDALELLELAWHDCSGEPNPLEDVIEDVWVVADGDLARLVSAAHLAVIDFRDLRLNAGARRAQR
jgi:hypothetical protein